MEPEKTISVGIELAEDRQSFLCDPVNSLANDRDGIVYKGVVDVMEIDCTETNVMETNS